MFEMNEWFRSQTVYTPEQVAKIRSDFSARVDKMSAQELQFVLADLKTKFQILDSREAREVRAWFGNYLSFLSNRRRDEMLQMIPEVSTMTSAQLQQTIARLAQRRDSLRSKQGAVQQLSNSATNPWNQGIASATGASGRTRNVQSSSYHSPYRAPSFERPFDNVPNGPQRTRTIDPMGGIWVNF